MKFGLVVDLGATNLRVSIVNDNHEIVKKEKISSDKNKDIALQIFEEYKKIDVGYSIEKIVVGVPGTINSKKGIIRDLPNLNVNQYDLKSALVNLFGIPVELVNDASLAAIGEYSKHKDEKVFQYITISSGIGGALIYKGELFSGNNGFEQEIGRMVINDDLFEKKCSGNALKLCLEKNNIFEEYPSNALISKDEKYECVKNEWLNELSIGISNIVKVVNPSIIVFGGGIGVYIDYYKQGLLERLKKELPIDVVDDLKLVEAYYKDDSALVGGSYLIFQDN